jgi:cyclic beta-1,2-glucan synthetase
LKAKRDGAPAKVPPKTTAPPASLEFFNGVGGFAPDGREYVTILAEGQWTPAPWVNVISNPSFGFQVATTGSGYTWSIKSREPAHSLVERSGLR